MTEENPIPFTVEVGDWKLCIETITKVHGTSLSEIHVTLDEHYQDEFVRTIATVNSTTGHPWTRSEQAVNVVILQWLEGYYDAEPEVDDLA